MNCSFVHLAGFHSQENYKRFFCKWFEPMSISSLSSVIVRARVVMKRTVVVDID